MTDIRICLIGDFAPNPDEGMRKSALQLRDALSKNNELICLEPVAALRSKELGRFDPDFIQYISGPTPMSLTVLKLLKLRARRARTVSTITHPQHVRSSVIWGLLSPDIVLTFSPNWMEYLSRFKTKVWQIPGAVETARFKPVGEKDRTDIRRRLGLPEDAYIALHVGHMRRGRGLMRMAPLASRGVLPLIVTSESTGQDSGLKEELAGKGCRVVDRYVRDIESYYQASDCYVFPTLVGWRGMDLPLSIIEAMACDLPVVSMDFGCVAKLYGTVPGVRIVRTDDELVASVADLKGNPPRTATRKAVENNDWDGLANAIVSIYEGARGGGDG